MNMVICFFPRDFFDYEREGERVRQEGEIMRKGGGGGERVKRKKDDNVSKIVKLGFLFDWLTMAHQYLIERIDKW